MTTIIIRRKLGWISAVSSIPLPFTIYLTILEFNITAEEESDVEVEGVEKESPEARAARKERKRIARLREQRRANLF